MTAEVEQSRPSVFQQRVGSRENGENRFSVSPVSATINGDGGVSAYRTYVVVSIVNTVAVDGR